LGIPKYASKSSTQARNADGINSYPDHGQPGEQKVKKGRAARERRNKPKPEAKQPKEGTWTGTIFSKPEVPTRKKKKKKKKKKKTALCETSVSQPGKLEVIRGKHSCNTGIPVR